MPLSVKPGVSLEGLRPAILRALAVIVEEYEGVGSTCTVTAGTDGKHMEGSLHYVGMALDIRTRNLNTAVALPLQRRIAAKLGKDYQVFLESDHLHVEFQPEKPHQCSDCGKTHAPGFPNIPWPKRTVPI